MTPERYNFHKPSRLSIELQEQVVDWLSAAFALTAEKWAQHLAVPVTHALEGVDTVRPVEALQELSDSVVAYQVAVGPDELRTLIVLPRPLLVTLAAGVLGEECAELASDRSLTAVEASLVEYLMQMLLAAIQESWPVGAAPKIRLIDAEPSPKRTRLFKPEENLARFALTMSGPFGEQRWQWLVPHKGLAELFGRSLEGQGPVQEAVVRTQLESLVGAMPLEVRVRLGGAVLHVSELARLRTGDLVLLDQPVSSPLPASVAGETRFMIWPGRVGPMQAIQIESLVES